MSKILLVEDDVELATRVRDFLKFEKHTVDMVHSGGDALQLLRQGQYELVILDWMLPDMTGLDVCRQFRGTGGMAPVIFLTAQGGLEYKELGFESGADDYLTKPIHLKELSMRIRAVSRRSSEVKPELLSCASLVLETRTQKVRLADKEIDLLPKEFSLLEYLMRHPGQHFTASDLLKAVWSADSKASEDTIRTYIKTLRQKIDLGEIPPRIINVRGVGYRIECE